MAQQIYHHTHARVTVAANSKTHYGVNNFIKSLSLDNSEANKVEIMIFQLKQLIQ